MTTNNDYKKTNTYKNSNDEIKNKIEKYKKDNKINDNHMYLLLLREDYRRLPKEEKQKGNRPVEMMLISGIIVFLVLTATQNRQMLPFAGIYMIIVTIIYFSGIVNPIYRELSNINKLLKKFPEVPKIANIIDDKKEEE